MTNAAQETTTKDTQATRLEKSIALVKNFRSKCGANIQVNKSGGVFLRHPTFQAWSQKDGGKAYTASINMNIEVLRALVDNKMLLAEVKEFLKHVPTTMGLDADALAAFVTTYQKEKKA